MVCLHSLPCRYAAFRPAQGRPPQRAKRTKTHSPGLRALVVRSDLDKPAETPTPRPAELQTYRGYLGDTRSKKSRYSDAAIDQQKEAHRENMRTVFDFERWAVHRSSQRYWQHISGIPRSRIIKGLRVPLLSMFFYSLCVACWEAWKEDHPIIFLPSNLEPLEPFTLTTFALALLLAFRLDASYTRFMTARELWGNVILDARNLVRQAQAFLDDEEALEQLSRWTVAFPKVLMWHVRESCDLRTELQNVLLPAELDQILIHAQHRPNFVLSVLTKLVYRLPGAPEPYQIGMDATLTSFARSTTSCERLIKTPIPRAYTRHTSRFLVIWLCFLPFTLWRACHWVMVPAAVTIAFLLLGVEEIGVQIEEPFGILPLENLVDTIEANIAEMVASNYLVNELVERSKQLAPSNGHQSNGAAVTETQPLDRKPRKIRSN